MMNLEINKKAVQEASNKFMEQLKDNKVYTDNGYIPLSNYYWGNNVVKNNNSNWITNESFPYTNPSLDRAEMDRLIAALYSSTKNNPLNFLISGGTTNDKTDYNWTLDKEDNPLKEESFLERMKPEIDKYNIKMNLLNEMTMKEILDLYKDVNPLVNKEINYCQTGPFSCKFCGSDLGDNGKCNCTPKEVINEIVYTPTKSEESVIYYTPDKKETVANYISAVDPVSMGSSVPIVTTYTLTTSNELETSLSEELYDYCKENELTLLIDFANNKVIVDNQHFTSDSIEKSIEMALSFIE